MKLRNLYNPLVMALLRSPLHPLMSGTVLLLTYKGRRSGRTHTTPLSYVRDGGDLLLVGSREHSWWKSLRGGVPVRLRIRGRNAEGVAEAFEGAPAEERLLVVLREVPAYRRHWKVELGPDGNPKDPWDLARIAEENVVVRVRDLTKVREK